MAPNMRRTQSTRSAGKRSGGGFVYHKRSVDSVKKRAERTGGRFDSWSKPGFDTWRAKQGDNLIRFLPPTWDDHEHYAYTVWMHGFVGPDNSSYLCPQKMDQGKCPICAAAKEARDAGEDDEGKKLQAKEQLIAWIIDRDEDEPKPQLYQMSWTMDRDISALCYSKRDGKILLIDHPEEGYDVSMQRKGAGLNTRYFGIQIDRKPSPISDDEKEQEEILQFVQDNPIPDVLHFYDATYLENMLSGTEPAKDKDLDEDDQGEDVDDSDRRGRRARRRSDDDADVDDKPRRRGRQVDEENDADADADDRPRRSSRVQRDDADDMPDDDGEPRRSRRRSDDDGERVERRRSRERDDDQGDGDDGDTSQDYDHEEDEARSDKERKRRSGSRRRSDDDADTSDDDAAFDEDNGDDDGDRTSRRRSTRPAARSAGRNKASRRGRR